jgi:hypothetical protein
MCFSAEASFTMSAILLVTAVAAIKKVTAPRQIVFASIPLVFSIQQCIEGFIWLSLTGAGNAQWQMPGTYLFLLFAMVVWPIWVPLSFLLMETDKTRREILSIIVGVGTSLSVYMVFALFYYPVNIIVTDHHIHYDLLFPYYLRWFSSALYFLPTVLSPLVSSVKKTWMLVALVLAANIVSRIFFHDYVLSVWCFFAAVISVIVLRIMWELNGKTKEVKIVPATIIH